MFDDSNKGLQHFLDMSGYQPITTFWQDFTIAEHFGEQAIKNTFDRAFNEWKNNVEYITELTMMTNWKIWYWNEQNETIARLYDSLWRKADEWCCKNLKGDDLLYYYRTTD